MVYTVAMSKKKKSRGNEEMMRAFIELRKGSRTSPHDTRPKRLRTKERIMNQALREDRQLNWA